MFLHHALPILRRQRRFFAVYVIEQVGEELFNRAALQNVGFSEALDDDAAFDCFLFHDVDLLAEDDRHPYACDPRAPLHLAPYVDKFSYRLPFNNANAFGGAVALTRRQFLAVNGNSNAYFGWGGEDDDLAARARAKGMKIERGPPDRARFKMIRHSREKSNAKNENRRRLLAKAAERMDVDGLNSLRYTRVEKRKRKLFTLVRVQLDRRDLVREK